MPSYELLIKVIGEDATAPAVQGLDKLSAGSVAAGNIIADVMQKAAGAVVGFAGDSIRVAGDFEAGMNQFKAAAGDSLGAAGLSVNDFKEQFLSLGAELPVSTSEVQQAAIALIKGGLDPAVVHAGALKDSLLFAAAAGMGLADAAELGIKMLGTFVPTTASAAEQTTFLANAQDLLVKAAGASTLDVDKLGAAMLGAGGQARASGVDYKDFVTTMGLISPTFDSAATAGVSYKNFLARLQPTTKPAIASMQELGLWTQETGSAFYDAQGKFVGNARAAELLHNALAPLSDAQRAMALQTIFGNDAMGAASALANAGADGYAAFAAKMDAANGVAAQAAATQQGLNIAWDNFKGSIEALQITIGSVLIPVLAMLLNTILAPAINTVREFATAIFAAADPFAFLVTTIDSIVPGFASFLGILQSIGTFIVGNLVPILSGIGAAILGYVIPAVFALVPAFTAWAVSAGTAAIATLAAMAPLILLGAAVALLTAAWMNNWGGIQEKTAAVWAFLQPAFDQLVAWLSTNLPIAIAALAQLWTGTLWPALQAVGAYIMGTVIPALVNLYTYLATTVPAGIGVVIGWWNALVATVTNFVTNLQAGFGVVTATIGAFVASVQAGWGVVVAGVTGFIASIQAGWSVVVMGAQSAWASVVAVVTTTWIGIVAAVQSGIALVVGVLSAIGSVIATIVQAAWNTVLFVTQTAWNAIVALFAPIIAQIIAVIGPPIQSVIATWTWAWGVLQSVTATAWAGLVSVVSVAVSAIVSAAQSAAAALSSAWASIASAASSAWASVVSAVSTAAAGITTAVSAAGAAAGAAMSAAWAAIQSATATAWAAITTAISSAIATAQTAIQGVIAFIQSVWGGAQQAAQAQTSAAWSAIQTLITGAMQIIRTTIQTGIAAVQSIMATAWAVVVAAANNDFGKIPGIVSAGWEKIKAIMSAGVGAITAIAGIMASAAMSLGKSIVGGIISGIGSAAGALMDKLKSLASSALNAAKSALQSHSPSKLFADQVGTTIPEGIAAGIVAATPKATAATVELASKIVDLISKGADAFGKLRDLGHIPMSAVTDFTTTIQEAMNLFGTMTAGWNRSMISAAGQFQAKAGETVDLIAKGVDAMSKLRDFQAVPAAAISAFADALGFAITEIVRISTFEMRVALMGAVEFAAGAGKVIEIVAKGVEAFTKLATLGAPVAGSFLNFANQVSWLVMRMGQVAAQTDGSAVAAAGRFADGAGKVIAILSNGVDGLAKLATLAAPVQGMFVNFANQISWLVMRMAQVAVQMSADAVTKAAAFADGAGKVIGIIGSGVDGLAKLATLGAPVQGSFLNFGNQIGALVAAVSRVAATMNAQGVAAAGVFAEGAGKVLGIIGSGVDGLTKLATFEGVTEASVAVFARSVSLVVTWIQMVSLQFSTEGAAAAAVFAEGAGKILGIIANGVAGLAKLGEFQGVTEASVALFARAVSTIVKWIQMVSLQFTAEGTAAAALFAESAGKIMGIISSGVDGLTKLETFGGSTGAAIDLFTESLTMFTSRFAAGVASFSAEALANAALFAESAGKVLGILSNGVTGLAALQDLKPIAEGSIQKFVEMTNLLMTQIGAAAAGFSTDALAAAGKFADAAGKSVGILKSGVEGFYQVDTFAGVSAAAIGRFADGVKLTVDAMVQLSTMFTAEALTAAQRFAVVAEASTEFLKKGATGFDRLGEMKVKPGEGLDAFAVGIQQLVATMVRLSGIVSADMLTEANRIAIGIDQILTVLMASIKGFKDVADIVGGGTLGAVGNGLTSGIVKMLADIQAVVIPPAQNIGHSISVGLANGITAGAPAIQNAVFAAINAALAAARAALGIASPSKVFEQQIGMQMSAGMAQGVLGGMGQVNAAVGAVSNGAVTAGGATGSTNNSYGGDTYSITINQQPGQDARALVDTVMREIENRRRMRG